MLPAPSMPTPRGVKNDASSGVSLSFEVPPVLAAGPCPAIVVTPLWLPSRHTFRMRFPYVSVTMMLPKWSGATPIGWQKRDASGSALSLLVQFMSPTPPEPASVDTVLFAKITRTRWS